MRFIPNYQLKILEEEEFSSGIKTIEEQLSACRNSGFFDTFDGKKIYYEYFLTEKSKASIVIVHGLSEFTKKFHEFSFYLLNQGYNVFLYDQRCHGLSCRLTDDPDMIHVDDFGDYVKDLDNFIENIVKPADDKPLYLYSHSMGGAVTIMYLAEKENTSVKKAILSSPLIDPFTGKAPPFFARIALKLSIKKYGKNARFRFAKDFNPNYPYEKSSDASKCRFEHNLNTRINNKCYQTTPTTSGWVYGSLQLKKKFLNSKFTDKIKTPLLIISAENDTVVKNPAQVRFTKKCKACNMITIKDAKHSIFAGKTNTIITYMDKVLSFFS